MSEVVNHQPNPEQDVFGDAFTFAGGESDDATRTAFFADRVTKIRNGDTAWLPRTLDADSGICADLYKGGKVVASLVFEYDDNSASVYTTSEGGSFGDTTLCDRVGFADAVAAATQFAE